MSFDCRYRFAAEAATPQGKTLGMLPLVPDFEPALQGCQLEGMRQGRLPPRMRFGPGGRIEPVWDSERGAPYLLAVQASLENPEGERFAFEVSKAFLHPAVEVASSSLVESGKLVAGERFTYRVCAFLDEPTEPLGTPELDSAYTVEEVSLPLVLAPGSLDKLIAGAQPRRQGASQSNDLPVLIDAAVLVEAIALARQAGTLETGGILVGQLHRDIDSRELFARITAQIPALHTRSTATRLTFTPETWAAVRAAITLRAREEIYLGWWHYHPNFCRNCPPERRRVCTLTRPFFSEEDCALHRTVFGRAFDLALLFSDIGADELSCDLFGWRQGVIAARGFHVLP